MLHVDRGTGWVPTAAPLLLLLLIVGLVGAGCGEDEAEHGSPLSPSVGRPDLDSVEGQVGDLRLLHVYIASPGERGGTHTPEGGAELLLTVANDGDADDTLSAVSSEEAAEVVLRQGGEAATSSIDVPVPAGGVADLQDVAGPHLELTGLREELRSGTSVEITFTFTGAGSVTLQVPVATYDPAAVSSTPADPS